jgi:hypothetical protein
MTRLDRRYWRYVISTVGQRKAKQVFAERLAVAKGKRKLKLMGIYKEVFYNV